MDRPKVGVVLLNWNGGDLTIPCIRSLLESEWTPWRILVVDNASTDRSPDDVAEAFHDVDLFRSETNLGFAGGNNEGMKQLLAGGADYVWVLNNDTVVDPKCLVRLMEVLEGDPSLAVATAKILFEDPADLIWYAGGYWRHPVLTVRHRGLKERDEGQYDEPADVEFLSGCCMLFRRSALEEVGLFNEKYFIYNEDSEWCLRAMRKGLRMRYVPEARLWHRISATMNREAGAGKASPWAEELMTRNALFMIRAHARRPGQYLCAMAYLLAQKAFRAAALRLMGRASSSRAIWNGIVKGLTHPPE